jgi:hypothetical protein
MRRSAQPSPWLALLASALAALAAVPSARTEEARPHPASPALPCLAAQESGLPLPSSFAHAQDPAAYQGLLSRFLQDGVYERLGWCEDKSLRDTGPFIDGSYYGTHPVVRVWYSPSFARWLVEGRRGEVPDGAMIVKEQFDTPPASQYQGWTSEQVHAYFHEHYDWTVMVRDRRGVGAADAHAPTSARRPYVASGLSIMILRTSAGGSPGGSASSPSNCQCG